jgi:hypothetical protein
MRTIHIDSSGTDHGFLEARAAAEKVACETHGETVCMSWYDRAADRESPAHASECHGTCEVPGYVEYAESRGADLRIVVDDGAYVFCHRPLGEFADAPGSES